MTDDPRAAPLQVEVARSLVGSLAFVYPVFITFREDYHLPPDFLMRWHPPTELPVIIARGVRGSIPNAKHGQVKAICGGPLMHHMDAWTAFANMGLMHDRFGEPTVEDSTMSGIAEFLAKYFDAALLHEALGKLLEAGVKK